MIEKKIGITLFYSILQIFYSILFYSVFSILYSILSCKLSKIRIDVLYISIALSMAKCLDWHAGKQGDAGSIPRREIYFHF